MLISCSKCGNTMMICPKCGSEMKIHNYHWECPRGCNGINDADLDA